MHNFIEHYRSTRWSFHKGSTCCYTALSSVETCVHERRGLARDDAEPYEFVICLRNQRAPADSISAVCGQTRADAHEWSISRGTSASDLCGSGQVARLTIYWAALRQDDRRSSSLCRDLQISVLPQLTVGAPARRSCTSGARHQADSAGETHASPCARILPSQGAPKGTGMGTFGSKSGVPPGCLNRERPI